MDFAQSASIALARIADAREQSLILILSDINMPGMSGLELLPKAKAIRPDVPIVMITAYGDAETKCRVLENGNANALHPRWLLLARLRHVTTHHECRLSRANRKCRERRRTVAFDPKPTSALAAGAV